MIQIAVEFIVHLRKAPVRKNLRVQIDLQIVKGQFGSKVGFVDGFEYLHCFVGGFPMFIHQTKLLLSANPDRASLK